MPQERNMQFIGVGCAGSSYTSTLSQHDLFTFSKSVSVCSWTCAAARGNKTKQSSSNHANNARINLCMHVKREKGESWAEGSRVARRLCERNAGLRLRGGALHRILWCEDSTLSFNIRIKAEKVTKSIALNRIRSFLIAAQWRPSFPIHHLEYGLIFFLPSSSSTSSIWCWII